MKLLKSLLNQELVAQRQGQNPSDFYGLTATALDGSETSFASLRGKGILFVNSASKCGFTAQYKGLESLFQEYKESGLTVLAFPSNDFGKQEPRSNSEIAEFCSTSFSVTFPMFEKGSVAGPEKQPVYQYLMKYFPGHEIAWNFEKILVNTEGYVSRKFSSFVRPESKRLQQALASILNI